MSNHGCCNATTARILAAINSRLEHERSNVSNADFKRGLEVANLIAKEAVEQAARQRRHGENQAEIIAECICISRRRTRYNQALDRRKGTLKWH